MKIFGFEILVQRPKKEITSPVVPSQYDEDTTLVTSAVSAGGYFGQVLDMEGTIKTENDLLRRYRQIAQYSDCEFAIDEIVNEAIVANEGKRCVNLNLDGAKIGRNPLSDKIKEKIQKEFDKVIKLTKFENKGHNLFRQWYIDGRLLFHVLINKENIKEGIRELRKMDPRKVRKIKKIYKEKNAAGVDVITHTETYYIYNNKGISESNVNGIRLGRDSVVHISSGLTNSDNGMTLSHLHKAIKATNQLKMVEDSLVIYRISRAPERRIFYVDVGSLSKLKAEQYVRDLMNNYRNKIVYDATTGDIRDDRQHMSILEDFWMPRREGGKGTEITTLPGGENLGQITDIEYFQTKLFRALNVPIGRFQQQQGFTLGISQEISRDEIKFNKFILRLRKRFADLFSQILRVQLIAKEIIREDEWEDIHNSIRYDFVEDNYFSELKEQELFRKKAVLLQMYDRYIGIYISKEWIWKNILRFTDDEIKETKKQMMKEALLDQKRTIKKAKSEYREFINPKT